MVRRTDIPANFRPFLNMDATMVREIMRSDTQMREQGPGWLDDYGGPQGYINQAHMTQPQRVTFNAVLQGYSTEAEIADVTTLHPSDVKRSLTWLERKRYIEPGVVTA